ncbi:hypothetical protein GCM10011396_01000 [Undibacterium terreum]|uniref:Uncharacterized protein n=1 Tax=Undibacterium terreum TaxID=1224302 RepID=A0A916XAU3_9BURK|nr:hypothetical protein GCM10011396_01000 [Undibacterium terreum]
MNSEIATSPIVFDTAILTPYSLLARRQASERPATLMTEPKKPIAKCRTDGSVRAAVPWLD